MRWSVDGSYRGIKLLEHAMKVFESVVEIRLRQILCIDEMQIGFTPGKGTTDARVHITTNTGNIPSKEEGSMDGLCGS